MRTFMLTTGAVLGLLLIAGSPSSAQAQVVVQGGIGVAPYYAPGYARPGIYAGAYPYSYPAYGGYYVGPRVSVGISPFFYGGYRGYYGRPGVYGGWGYRGYGYGRGRR